MGLSTEQALAERDGWVDQLSPVRVPAAEGRTEQDFSRCIQDPALFRLWVEMMQAIEQDAVAFLAQAEDLDGEGS